jgi:NADPH:quinone reductase-like Zn-dependent oxidoreductase
LAYLLVTGGRLPRQRVAVLRTFRLGFIEWGVSPAYTPDWGNKILEMTDGRGVDLVVEVGGSGTVSQSIRAVRMGGHISMIGVLTGIGGDVPTAELFQKNAVISGITVGSRAQQMDMVRALDANGVKPVISDTFDLKNLADAFRLQESQGQFGKICISC